MQEDIWVKLAPVRRLRRSTGGFFKHINLTHFDLSRYGVYQKEEDIECEDNCLFTALKHAGFPENQLDDLRITLRTRDIPEYRLKEVCQRFTCRIKVSKRDNHTPTYGKEGPIYEIGLLDEHYFVNDLIPITTFAIKHYDDVKNEKDCNKIYRWTGKAYKRGDRSSKSVHIIDTLLQSQQVRPIEYGDVIMATAFHDKFKQKTGIVLKEIPESNIQEKKEKKERSHKEVLRYFFDFETCPNDKNEDGTNAEALGETACRLL